MLSYLSLSCFSLIFLFLSLKSVLSHALKCNYSLCIEEAHLMAAGKKERLRKWVGDEGKRTLLRVCFGIVIAVGVGHVSRPAVIKGVSGYGRDARRGECVCDLRGNF